MVEKKTTKTTKAAKKTTKKSPAVKHVKKDKESVAEKVKAAPAGKYIYAVGRRKTSTAKVRIVPNGSGDILINTKPFKNYFPWLPWQRTVLQPLSAVGAEKSFDVAAVVAGGGLAGQADAVAHGIARALVKSEESYKKVLRSHGLLTRDPRMKERKKPGLKRARRAPQWSKR